MCNINLLIKKIRKSDFPFLQAATNTSFLGNSHAEGFMTPQTYHKSFDKIWIQDYPQVVNQPWIAFHERLATHGENKASNIHPIINKGVFLMHNGVMNLDDKVKSDSYIFAENISKKIKEGNSFIESMVKTIEETVGRKSLLMYDTVTGSLYYFKDASTDFYLAQGKGELFASTSKVNVAMAVERYGFSFSGEVPAGILFEIKNGEFMPLQEVESKSYSYANYGYYGSSAYYDRYDEDYYSNADSPSVNELFTDADESEATRGLLSTIMERFFPDIVSFDFNSRKDELNIVIEDNDVVTYSSLAHYVDREFQLENKLKLELPLEYFLSDYLVVESDEDTIIESDKDTAYSKE